jgi:RNA polymerase sigma factor (sigma-70 family)
LPFVENPGGWPVSQARAAGNPRDIDLDQIEPLVRRVLAARLRDRDAVDDLVQETLTRLIEARDRLDIEALTPYAVVTARNLAASLARSEDRRRRHAHRLVDLQPPEMPHDRVLVQEERRAVAAALTKLSDQDRRAVVEHEVMDVDTATLARELRSTPGGVAVRLARARAKMRVDYLIALRGVELPTDRCRPVLIALSAGDRRRQVALDAGTHLLECTVCASLSDPLMERSRALAALLPFPGVGRVLGIVRRSLQTTSAQVGTGAATAVAVGAVVLAVTGNGSAPQRDPGGPPPEPPATVLFTSSKEPALAVAASGELARFRGEAVEAKDAVVAAVPANEGFWIGRGERRLWIQVIVKGESEFDLEPGDKVSFRGTLVGQGADFARRAGVSRAEGAELLRRAGHHVEVPSGELEISGQSFP